MSQAADVQNALVLDRLQDLWVCGIIAATEHEILPDENAQLVADIVEYVFFPNAASPYPRVRLAKMINTIVKNT